jgi:hypothetical protein
MRRTRTGDIRERFFDRFEIDKNTGCWNWKGTIGPSGYGVIGGKIDGYLYSPAGQNILAHRASWILHFGPIPVIENAGHHGTVVRHKCDNRKCVNPDHLEIGTQADNVKDMDNRGGANRIGLFPKRGEWHHNAVLNAAQAEYIISSTKTNGELAEEIGVSKDTIRRARCGKTGYTDAETSKRLRELAKTRNGLSMPGVKNPRAKLTTQQVEYIRASKLSTYKIAVELGIHQTTAARARRSATY